MDSEIRHAIDTAMEEEPLKKAAEQYKELGGALGV